MSLEIIQRIAKKVKYKYSFGYYDPDDIEQEAIILGLTVLDKYKEGSGSLDGFLYTHITNRLKTLKRDKYSRNIEKMNLVNTLDISIVNMDNETSTFFEEDLIEKLDSKELYDYIDKNIPAEYRVDFLKLKDGKGIPTHRKEKLKEIIAELVDER